MRVVLDTNIVVSATLIRGGNEGRILRALQRLPNYNIYLKLMVEGMVSSPFSGETLKAV